MKYTLGPWTVGVNGKGRFCVYSANTKAHGRGICVMSNTQPVRPDEIKKYGEHEWNLIADANAALIAAAPDLLEALKLIVKAFADGDIKFTEKRRADSDPYHPANVAMCAAIAKAEGRE